MLIFSVMFTDAQWRNITAGLYKNLLSNDHEGELMNASVLQLTSKDVYCIMKEVRYCFYMISVCIGLSDVILVHTGRRLNNFLRRYCQLVNSTTLDHRKLNKSFWWFKNNKS